MNDLIEIPVITMYGPWAHWVREGWKGIETRLHQRFKCLDGKRIGIHVSQRWDKNAIEAARRYMTMEQREKTGTLSVDAGHIICTVDAEWVGALSYWDAKAALIECDTERFGLKLTNRRRLPICSMTRCAGKQGIWMAMLPRLWVYSANVLTASDAGKGEKNGH